MTPWLGGKSVLIVEDEFLIGLMLIKEITRAGGTPLGPVTSVADALKEIVYEMRFDEVSARYGEFGPFYINMRLSPADLWQHLHL